VSIGPVQASFYPNPQNSGAFDPIVLVSGPSFTQQFPVIDFNPPAAAQVGCSNTTGVNEFTRPFTDVVPNPDGTCSTLIAQDSAGVLQAGGSPIGGALSEFQAIFTANLTVATAGSVRFNFFSDDGWILAIGSQLNGTAQPTTVIGQSALFNAPPGGGIITHYPVVGAYNGPSSPALNIATVNFPSAGTYPIEVDYTECCGGQLALVMGTTFGNPILPSPQANDFKQNVGAWAPCPLDNTSSCPPPPAQPSPCSLTFAQSGCFMAALADVLSHYGVTLPDGTPIDPGTLNRFLSTAQVQPSGKPLTGFASSDPSSGDTCSLVAGNVATLLHLTSPQVLALAVTKPGTDAQKELDAELNAGDWPIVGVASTGSTSGEHYLVVTAGVAPDANGNFTDYRILDPLVRNLPPAPGTSSIDNSGALLFGSKLYGSPQSLVIDHFSHIQHPGPIIELVGHSPIEFLVTAPDGTQTGFNPMTDTMVQGIAGASYLHQLGLADDQGVLPPTPGFLYFLVGNPSSGTYRVQVIGTGTGSYSVDVVFGDATGKLVAQTVTGTTLPGVVDTYLVTTPSTAGQPLVVQRQVQIDVKPGEDPPAINPAGTGKIPVAILTTATFSATSVDPQSLRLGPHGAGASQGAVEDVNGDGLPDLIVQFTTPQTGIASGDTQVCLTGKTTSGLSIVGCDTILTVPPK
jgi:hypothetical protein